MFALALPALLEQLLTFFVGFYDTWLSGEISAAATDAVGLATYVDWLGGMLFRLVGIGAAAIVARHWGASEFDDANRTTNRALALASVMGLAVSALMYLSAPLFTLLLGMQGESREIAIYYLRVDSICYSFLSFTFVGGAILRASGDMRTPMLIYAIVGVVNVIAATAYVYGFGPIPKFGVNGIVMGTVTARIFGGVLIVAGFARGFGRLRLVLREWRLRGEMVARIMRTGVPAAADGALTWIGIFLFLMVVARGNGWRCRRRVAGGALCRDSCRSTDLFAGRRLGICRRGDGRPGRSGAGDPRRANVPDMPGHCNAACSPAR